MATARSSGLLLALLALLALISIASSQLSFANDNYVRIGVPQAFGTPEARSAQYTISATMNISYTLWADNVNSRGGIPIQGKNYLVELVVIDVGHPTPSIESQLVAAGTRDLVNGKYGRIDFIFPAYTSGHATTTLAITDPAEMPVVGSWGETSVLRCYAPLPSNCATVGARRWKWGGFSVNGQSDFYLSGFYDIAKLKGASTVAILAENASFTISVANGAKELARRLKVEEVSYRIIDRHVFNPLLKAEANYSAADIKQRDQLREAVAELKRINADIVAVGSYTDLCRNIMNEFHAQDYLPKAIGTVTCIGQPLINDFAATGNRGDFMMGASGWATGLRGTEYTEVASDPMFHYPVTSEDVNELSSTELFAKAYVAHPLYAAHGFKPLPTADGRSFVLPNYQLAMGYVQGYAVYQALVSSNSFAKADWQRALAGTQFNSLWGAVALDNSGHNYAKIFITQQLMPDTSLPTITPLSSATANIIYPMPTFKERIFDASPYHEIADRLFVALALLGALICAVLIVIFVLWQDRPQVQAASLAFLIVILVGGIIAFTSIVFWTTYVESAFCILQPWLLVIGVDIFIVPLLVKNIRLYILFKAARNLRRRVVSMEKMLLMVAVATFVDVIVLIVWHAAYAPTAVVVVPDPYRQSLNYVVCRAQNTPDPSGVETAFISVLGAYKGIQIIFGLVLTFLLRKVPTEFNEGKYIGYAMYNLGLSLILLLIIWLSLPQERLFSFIARAVVLLWALYVAVFVIFLPKVYFVLTGAKATLRRTTENSRKATHSLKSASMSSDDEAYGLEKKLGRAKKEIELLRKELTKHDPETVKKIKERMEAEAKESTAKSTTVPSGVHSSDSATAGAGRPAADSTDSVHA